MFLRFLCLIAQEASWGCEDMRRANNLAVDRATTLLLPTATMRVLPTTYGRCGLPA